MFVITNSPAANDVKLIGIHRAADGMFSAMGPYNVQDPIWEMGPLATCVPNGPLGYC